MNTSQIAYHQRQILTAFAEMQQQRDDLLAALEELDQHLEAAWNARTLPADIIPAETVRRTKAALAASRERPNGIPTSMV